MGLDLVELWEHMSIIVKLITVMMILMSVFMFYVIAERLLTFRAASDQSIRYVQALGEYLRQHKVNEALNAARGAGKSPVAKVMESGLTALLQGREALTTKGPDDVTKTEIQRSGKDKLIGSFKLCISTGGAVTQVTKLKSTGFPAYDAKILGKMRNEWRYKPYMVNGKAVPVCTAVTFIYTQK